VNATDQLFRQNYGRMVTALTRVLGVPSLSLAEDVVQEAFCRAVEVWADQGLPENPSAWLMVTAKNRALDLIRRRKTARDFEPELARWLQSEWTLSSVIDESFSPAAVKDDILRMMFSCCDPRIAETSQIALILQILCGFTVDEVAAAFVSKPAAIAKRIMRAKQTLATSKRLFDVTSTARFSARIGSVQRALYLLFNEGYHGASPTVVRAELCFEAMRLLAVLMRHPDGDTAESGALAALMSFHAARLPARVDAGGNLVRFTDQDRSKWNQELLRDGVQLMDRASVGSQVSEFHIEAAIASVHAMAPTSAETDWHTIVLLYDALMRVQPSAIVALNRAIAIGQCRGSEAGLEAIRGIRDSHKLDRYPFYEAAMGELEERRGDLDRARGHYERARAVARNAAERRYLGNRMASCAPASAANDRGPSDATQASEVK
jgi:RNA polymerase sigma-70 factor (ECF subfamily)